MKNLVSVPSVLQSLNQLGKQAVCFFLLFKRLLREIDRILEIWDRPFIEFADDNSFVDRRYWKVLLPRLAGRRVKWFTETDVSVGEDDELLALAASAGMTHVFIGVETPNEESLELTRKRQNLPQHLRNPHQEDPTLVDQTRDRIAGKPRASPLSPIWIV